MTAKKYLPIAIFIGVQACLLQALDQVLCGAVHPMGNAGFGWVSFQAWAMYFLAGCTPKGGIRTLIGYLIGMVASILIISGGGAVSGVLGFWAVPLVLLVLVPIILYLDIAPEMFNFVPAVFVGAGAYFGFMTYVPGAAFGGALVTETLYCVIGLVFGFCTITFRGWYEAKYVNAKSGAAK